ncbi:hypothetical protein chiPu_0027527 [Chiloscyllium punctatum]|uniref:Uncharacterized protein n=1 Tax=Chiloscyllium punctatum TaxID=137246 RepID=A0A401TKX3_CHIPU|nr:hypothetical protein [Chiloscyllium punctatum]
MCIPDRATPGYCESHSHCLTPNDRACPANTGCEPGALLRDPKRPPAEDHSHTQSYRVLYRYLTARPTLFTGSDNGRQRSPSQGTGKLLRER